MEATAARCGATWLGPNADYPQVPGALLWWGSRGRFGRQLVTAEPGLQRVGGHMRNWRTWAAALVVTLISGHARADPVVEAADAVLLAAKRGDTLRLRFQAQRAEPDPWLVAEELLSRGEADAAMALARASEAADIAGLAAYVARERAVPSGKRHRPGLAQAGRALDEGRPQAALAHLREVDASGLNVSAVMTCFARGVAEQRVGGPAARSFVEAAALAERLGWLAQAKRAWDHAVEHSLQGGRLEAARDGAMRLLAVADRRGHRVDGADAHRQLASVAIREGRAQQALQHLEQARRWYGTALDASGKAMCLIAEADIRLRAGGIERAERQFKEAVALAAKAERPELEARARRGLGVVAARLGSYARAESELRRAGRLAEQAGLEDVRADVASNLGVVLLHRGRYSRALALGHEGIAMHERGTDRTGLAAALMNLGLTHASLGKGEVALRHLERAQSLYQALGDRAGAGRALSNLGVVHGALGDLDEALACQEQALRLSQDMQDRAGQALALGRLGHVHGQRGSYAQAIELHERAIGMKRELKDRLGEAISLEAVGHLHQQLGDTVASRARRRESLALANALGAGDLAARNHWGLAEVALMSADPERALRSAREAVSSLPPFARGLFDEQGAHARERWAGVYDVGMTAAAALDDVASFVWFLERQRAATLLESLGGCEALVDVALPDSLQPILASARETEARTLRRYRDAQESGSRRSMRKVRGDLTDARHALREVRERISREAAATSRLIDPKPESLRRLRALMRPDDALVLFALLPDQAYATIVTTRGAVLRPLGPSRSLVEACSGLEVEGPGHLGEDAVAHFHRLLVAPLGLDGRIRRVFLSPDGALCSVPFPLLLNEKDVIHVPSGSAYAHLRKTARRTGTGRGVLALGRPVYGLMKVEPDPRADGTQRGSVRKAHPAGTLPPLDGSAEEVRAIGDLVLTDGDATEDALKAAVLTRERWRAVHLACHGLVDFDHPLFSALALTPNRYGDGLLTTLDVFGMRVPSDLVVLSACESGRGRLLRTEGVFGFTRAFMFAGAPRVVVSLWKVDDEATRALMVKFYEIWNPKEGDSGIPAARALRQAQAHVRSQPKWRDPYYWAAWQLWGVGE